MKGESKQEREQRLSWQSALLLWLVLPAAAAGLATCAFRSRTTATAEGLGICAAFGLLVWLLRAATPFAATAGFVLTSCMYLGTVEQPEGSWIHTALLCGLALFVLAFTATRFRRGAKEKQGTAESRRGRNAAQVTANMGAGALFALALCGGRKAPALSPLPLIAGIVAALCEAAADTVSSEIGQAVGGTPRLLTSLQRVPTGTDGAVSLLGTLVGAAAAAITALIAIPTLQLGWNQAALSCGAGIFGLFLDSLIGATLERGAMLNNDAVNFLSTTAAAIAAYAGARMLGR